MAGIDLAPGHNYLEVEFRAIHFDIGEGLRYQYWLEGADSDWSEPSDAETVRYANLSPVNYRLAVRSITESVKSARGRRVWHSKCCPSSGAKAGF
ncbi:MAG: triple tyrosine motif-containing protein [Bryobacteraceae bacterium]